jgi:hypothetical protein
MAENWDYNVFLALKSPYKAISLSCNGLQRQGFSVTYKAKTVYKSTLCQTVAEVHSLQRIATTALPKLCQPSMLYFENRGWIWETPFPIGPETTEATEDSPFRA